MPRSLSLGSSCRDDLHSLLLWDRVSGQRYTGQTVLILGAEPEKGAVNLIFLVGFVSSPPRAGGSRFPPLFRGFEGLMPHEHLGVQDSDHL